MVNVAAKTYLKWMLRTPTVMKMEKVTRSIVNRRYLPSSGTAREVGGIISASSKKNTVSDSRIEIHRVTLKHEKLKHNTLIFQYIIRNPPLV